MTEIKEEDDKESHIDDITDTLPVNFLSQQNVIKDCFMTWFLMTRVLTLRSITSPVIKWENHLFFLLNPWKVMEVMLEAEGCILRPWSAGGLDSTSFHLLQQSLFLTQQPTLASTRGHVDKNKLNSNLQNYWHTPPNTPIVPLQHKWKQETK